MLPTISTHGLGRNFKIKTNFALDATWRLGIQGLVICTKDGRKTNWFVSNQNQWDWSLSPTNSEPKFGREARNKNVTTPKCQIFIQKWEANPKPFQK